jgi:hypothetical protein
VQSFEEASQFLETFLSEFGLSTCSNGNMIPASGELLFFATQLFFEIERFVNLKEQEIIQKLGDRREKFGSDQTSPRVQLPGYRYLLGIHAIECIGRTSHNCGVVVMLNLLGIAEPELKELAIDPFATWEELTSQEREKIAQCEQSFAMWGGAAMLAEGVRFERLAIAPAASCQLREKAKAILNADPQIKQRQFCRKLHIGDKIGGELYRDLTGKQKQHRNTN